MSERDQLFLVGFVCGSVLAALWFDADLTARRARAAELRAHEAAIVAELEWLDRVTALAASNRSAASA